MPSLIQHVLQIAKCKLSTHMNSLKFILQTYYLAENEMPFIDTVCIANYESSDLFMKCPSLIQFLHSANLMDVTVTSAL